MTLSMQHLVSSMAKSIANAMFKVERTFPIEHSSEETQLLTEGVRITAEEICSSNGWDLELFSMILKAEFEELRKAHYGVCASTRCGEAADGDNHLCFECLHIEERLEQEYYEG